jgi:nitroreductase
MNAQDIDVYVFLASGAYLYNPVKNLLDPVANGDNRNVFSRKMDEPLPPVICLLVSDISHFKMGEDSLMLVWGAMDAGIVSQNIAIYCASAGMATRPRAGMNQQKLREILKLKDSQYLMLNNPVSYKK